MKKMYDSRLTFFVQLKNDYIKGVQQPYPTKNK